MLSCGRSRSKTKAMSELSSDIHQQPKGWAIDPCSPQEMGQNVKKNFPIVG